MQIKRLFDEPKLLRALQVNGMQRARNHFDVQISAQKIEEILAKASSKQCISSLQKF